MILVGYRELIARCLDDADVHQAVCTLDTQRHDEVARCDRGVLARDEVEGVAVPLANRSLADVHQLVLVGIGVGGAIHHNRGEAPREVGRYIELALNMLLGAACILGTGKDIVNLLGRARAVHDARLHLTRGCSTHGVRRPVRPIAPTVEAVGGRLATSLVGVLVRRPVVPPNPETIGTEIVTILLAVTALVPNARRIARQLVVEVELMVLGGRAVGDRVLVPLAAVLVAPMVVMMRPGGTGSDSHGIACRGRPVLGRLVAAPSAIRRCRAAVARPSIQRLGGARSCLLVTRAVLGHGLCGTDCDQLVEVLGLLGAPLRPIAVLIAHGAVGSKDVCRHSLRICAARAVIAVEANDLDLDHLGNEVALVLEGDGALPGTVLIKLDGLAGSLYQLAIRRLEGDAQQGGGGILGIVGERDVYLVIAITVEESTVLANLCHNGQIVVFPGKNSAKLHVGIDMLEIASTAVICAHNRPAGKHIPSACLPGIGL